MFRSSARVLVVGVAAALVAVAAVVGVAQSGGPSSAGEPDEPASPGGAVVSAFQAGATPAELPSTAKVEVASSKLPGLDLHGSVRALGDRGWRLYLTPYENGVCVSLVDPDGGASAECHSLVALASPTRPSSVLSGCEASSPTATPVCAEALLYGLAPDGVTAVSVHSGDDEVERAQMRNNAYMVVVDVGDRPTSVVFEGSGDATSYPLALAGGAH